MIGIIIILFYSLIDASPSTSGHNFNGVEYSDIYLYVADDKNNMRRVYSSEKIDEKIIKAVDQDHPIIYKLYTRNNPEDAQLIFYNVKNSIIVSNFDPAKVTVFIIHGWLGDATSTVSTLLTEAFLQDGDVNVIVVDWCEIACSKNYFTAIAAVPTLGRQIGRFIKWLITLGVSNKRLHLVGHSLGAHVAGNAGRETEGKIQRITGLDPAGPFWEVSSNSLHRSDAQYVELIHTNTDCLGYKKLSGDADFFPNGGSSMPGCKGSACSHSKSYYYMADSLKYNNLIGFPCSSMVDVNLNSCEGEPYLMGNNDLSKNRSGIFRVETELVSKKNSEEIEPLYRRNMYRRFFVSFPTKYDCIIW